MIELLAVHVFQPALLGLVLVQALNRIKQDLVIVPVKPDGELLELALSLRGDAYRVEFTRFLVSSITLITALVCCNVGAHRRDLLIVS